MLGHNSDGLWFRSHRPGFCLATSVLITVMLLMYAGAIQASLSLGPGGDFPRVRDVFLYALSHDDLPSLLVSVILLLMMGTYQECRWGSVALLALSTLTIIVLPFVYTLVLFVGGGEASRICGYSAVQLALVTAQCRQTTQRRLMRCLPVWSLPWLLLLVGLLLLPGTPALLHFCAICIGHNYMFIPITSSPAIGELKSCIPETEYHQSFIGTLQELEAAKIFDLIPNWLYVPTSARFRLPTFTTSQSSLPQFLPVNQQTTPPLRDPAAFSHPSWMEPSSAWVMEESVAVPEAELLEEEMLRAGILASLQDAPVIEPDTKVEVPKSSVSSLRLQQLEKMGFPTEKAVVALAASKQLDDAISLLIEDSIGEQAVVVSKGKTHLSLQNT